jgi:hypothetical protein
VIDLPNHRSPIRPIRPGSLRRQPERRPVRARPTVEALEPRLVLSTLEWLGSTSGLWSVASNWKVVPTGLHRAPLNLDDLLFPSTASDKTTVDDVANLSISSIEFDASYSVSGSAAMTLGQGGVSVTSSNAIVDFQPGELNLTAPTIPADLASGSELDFLQTNAIVGSGNLNTTGSGSLVFLSQGTTDYSGSLSITGTVKVGISTRLPPKPEPQLTNAILVGPGGTFSVGGSAAGVPIGGGIVFGDLNPIGNIELDGGEVNVFPSDTLNTTSLSGEGTIDPAATVSSGDTGSGVLNIGPTVPTTSATGPLVSVAPGGTIAPGTAAVRGTLNVHSPVTFSTGSSLAIGFGPPGEGQDVDHLNVPDSPVTLNNATLSVSLPPPQAVGSTYTFLQGSEINGRFAGLPDGARLPNAPFVIHYVTSPSQPGVIGSVTLTRVATPNATADFEATGRSDLAVYLPSLGAFAIRPSTGGPDQIIPFGIAGPGQSLPATGDYDGLGKTQLAVYLPSRGAFAIRPTDGSPDQIIPFGSSGTGQSLPAPGDYDGLGKTNLAVYLPGQGAFAIRPSNGGPDVITPFGIAGAGQSIPAPGDYNGLGKTELAVYLPSLGAFAIRPSDGGPDQIIPFGIAGAGQSIPMPGDYDGSGKTELAVYLPSLGVFAYRPANGGPDVLESFGIAGAGQSIPAPGDYDGDGISDPALYFPSLGAFGIRFSSGGPDAIDDFGSSGPGQSIPVSAPSLTSFTVSGSSMRAITPSAASGSSGSSGSSNAPRVIVSSGPTGPGQFRRALVAIAQSGPEDQASATIG